MLFGKQQDNAFAGSCAVPAKTYTVHMRDLRTVLCIERDPKRGLQRRNFPFRTADIARLYLRTADHTLKRVCGVYEIKDDKGRVSYKIFGDENELSEYLKKNKNKVCSGSAVFSAGRYREFPDTQVRRLSAAETVKYLSERK